MCLQRVSNGLHYAGRVKLNFIVLITHDSDRIKLTLLIALQGKAWKHVDETNSTSRWSLPQESIPLCDLKQTRFKLPPATFVQFPKFSRRKMNQKEIVKKPKKKSEETGLFVTRSRKIESQKMNFQIVAGACHTEKTDI